MQAQHSAPLTLSRKGQSPLRSTALVVGAGLIALYVSSWQSFRALSWSDEIVYAVMGRNIAAGRGAISNFYDALSILRKGFPLGDVHMPGHAFLLAASFAVLGPTESAALVPSCVAFVLTGLLLFGLGRRLFDERVGVVAAVLFYVSPPMTAYAHTAMAELPLVFIGCAYFACWCRAMVGPYRTSPFLLAALIGLGATARETFLVLVPSALYALWRWPRPARLRGLIVFGAAFASCLLLVLGPLALARAPYPNFLSTILDLGAGPSMWRAVAHNFARNLGGLPCPGAHPSGWTFTYQYLAGALLPLFCLARPVAPRQLAAFVLCSHVATVAVLAGVYPLRDLVPVELIAVRPATWWAGVRALMFLAGPAAVLLAATIVSIRTRAVRWGVLGATIGLLSLISARSNAVLVADRIGAYRYDEPFSRFVAESTAAFHPRVVLAEGAFLYGWQAYPVNVIWNATAEPAEIAALERVIPIDVIVVGETRRVAIEEGVRTGELRGGYAIEAEPRRGVFVFVSRECVQRSLNGRPRRNPAG